MVVIVPKANTGLLSAGCPTFSLISRNKSPQIRRNDYICSVIKKVSISFFIFLILGQTFDRFGLITYYYLNKEYITEFFCINKEKPELSCNGKCYLSSELKKQEKEKSNLPIRVIENKDIQFVLEDFRSLSNQKLIAYLNSSIFFYLCNHSQGFFKDIFHPPEFWLSLLKLCRLTFLFLFNSSW